MKHTKVLTLVATLAGCLIVSETLARGGGGGGGRVGGGGGAARPAVSAPARPAAVARPATPTPSMSRPAGKPVASKPAVRPQVSKPNVPEGTPATRPAVTKPEVGSRPNPAVITPGVSSNRPNPGIAKPGSGIRPGIAGNQRPSQGQLNDFLDLPGQPGASTLPSTANRPNVDVKNPTISNKVGDKTNVVNNSNIGDKTKIGVNNNIGNKVNVGDKTKIGDVNINAGNKVTINRQNNINSIHNKYNNNHNHYHRPFGPGYWGGPAFGGPGWRWHAGWNRYPGNWCWRPCSWAAFGTWFVWQWAQPFNYNYGTSVVYTDNTVYIDGQQAATAEQYYQQADTIAASAPQNIDETKVEWMPLGVFAVTEEDATDTGMMVQLAVSKEGIIAGTFFNEITNTSRPVEGMVDRQTQRAVWKYADGKNTDIVMETGISNLTKDDATALVHFGPDKTQTWLMVRLPAPEDDAQK